MEKKSGLITVVIVVLALLVGLLGGYVLKDMLSENSSEIGTNENNADDKNTSEEKNDSNENNTQDNEQKKFTLDDAKNLMAKYVTSLPGIDVCGDYYISNLENENSKNYLALKSVNITEYLTCAEISNGNYADGNLPDCGEYWQPAVYPYEEVLNNKRELFGESSELSKETIKGPYKSYYDFFNEKDAFVYTGTYGGGDCGPTIEYSVYDYKLDNNVLYIYTLGRFDIDSSDVEEIRHKYTFKKQDSGYYMTDVEEIK